jgi:uncharacterized protein (DUF885 family)
MTATGTLRVASVQMEHKDRDREANFAKLERFTAQAAAQGAQLVVFPECCVCGYWFIRNLSLDELTALAEPVPAGPSTQRLRELAHRHGIAIGAGWIESAPDGVFHNTYVVALADAARGSHRTRARYAQTEISAVGSAMRSQLLAALAAATVMLVTGPAEAHSDLHAKLTELARDLVYSSASLFPTQATQLGIPGHDGELNTPSEQSRSAYIARLQQWQQQLETLAPRSRTDLELVDRNDANLLGAQLTSNLNALQIYRVDRKDYSAGANDLVGTIFIQLQFLPVAGRDGKTAADVSKAWTDITQRLRKAPQYIRASQKLVTEPGHLYGVVGSEELEGAPNLFNGALTEAARQHYAHDRKSFSRFAAARDATLAEVAKTKAYIDAHVAQWPENFAMGRRAYDQMLRTEQLLPLDSRDVERMAHDELAHGWAEEAWLVDRSKHDNVPFGSQSGGGMAPDGPALIDYYRARIAELRQFVTDHNLQTLPAWLGTINVQETPKFMQPVSPGASMISPRLLSDETNGYYFITPPTSLTSAAARLDMNQDFDHDRIVSTAAHEVMPGHFLQLSIARRHPSFIRKIQNSGTFAEGWAFYGEEMFVRLGLYGDDLDARLFTARWERVRGARAIVDPKLASGEWTYEQAADFYERETGFTHEAARAAAAAIATRPGYFIAYTVGRWQIQQLLAAYVQRTGTRGSLQDFHDRLLSYGCTPLSVVGPELLADLDKPAAAVRAAANY